MYKLFIKQRAVVNLTKNDERFFIKMIFLNLVLDNNLFYNSGN